MGLDPFLVFGVLTPSLGVVTPFFIRVSNLFHGLTLVLTGHHLVQLTKGKQERDCCVCLS